MHMKIGVESIDRALVVLGEKRLLQMVISVTFEDFPMIVQSIPERIFTAHSIVV